MATQASLTFDFGVVRPVDIQFNPSDAPPGFYAVPKASAYQEQGNLCRQCDWRLECQRSSDEDDRLCEKYFCGGYEVINRDGQTIGRLDKTSVLFKHLPVIA